MFRAAKMAKIRVICLKAIAPQVVKSLQQQSVLHITDSKLPELERSGPLPSFDDVSSRLVKIRTIKEAFGTAVLHGKTAPIGAKGSNRENWKLPKKKQAYESPLDAADELVG